MSLGALCRMNARLEVHIGTQIGSMFAQMRFLDDFIRFLAMLNLLRSLREENRLDMRQRWKKIIFPNLKVLIAKASDGR